MATASGGMSGFDDFQSDLDGPSLEDFEGGISDATQQPLGVSPVAIESSLEVAPDAQEFGSGVSSKDLLDVRGFFVTSGEGLYDGVTRENGEPSESYFVDVQDYDTGAIRRVWGIALRDVMTQAKITLDLQPGSRIHLSQHGKREMVFDSVNENREMVIRKTFANDWLCLSDRGPLPSQLAHLMAGVNVDALLDRLALRHGMALDDQRLVAWKQSQMRLIKAFGDDPETIKAWAAREMIFSQDEERALVAQALSLEGFGAGDAAAVQRATESRLSALRSMEPSARFDYLIETARPHLLAVNKEREHRLSQDVLQSIDGFCQMALPQAQPLSAERQALRSGLVQSIEGLTPTQQLDYLSQRRSMLMTQLLQPSAAEKAEVHEGGISKHDVIDATKLSYDEYREMLEKRLALAATPAERDALLAEEIAAREMDDKEAKARLKPISDFHREIMSSGEVSMTSYMAGRVADMLARAVAQNVMPSVKTLFDRLGGVGAWRRKGCEAGLADLQSIFAETKQTPVYQAFLDDPQVRSACGDVDPGKVLAQQPEMARTEVLQRHIQAQESAAPPAGKSLSLEKKGVWTKAFDCAHTLSDRISRLSPENLIKNGKVDMEWVSNMRKGLGDFASGLQQTLMPEKLREQLQEMLAAMMRTINVLLEMVRNLFSEKSATGPATAPAP